MTEKILDIDNLSLSFSTYAGEVQAIRGVSFDLFRGETLALVGESGSGKSVTARSIIGLSAENAFIKEGDITFNGQDLLAKTEKQMLKIRGNDISMIFQDPMTSLNPVLKIGEQIAEPLMIHKNKSRKQAFKEAERMLELVGIGRAKERMHDYPHQFSGGQRQRIVIAIALINKPQVLIADEPTTALDVTVQAQILELFQELQEEMDTSIIFITHDLGVVAQVADRVAVMYAGQIVEIGNVMEIFYNPQHPYTWGLITSMPTTDTEGFLTSIPGTPPDLLNPPQGDAFALRSDYAMAIDFEEEPPYFQISDSHFVKSWLAHPQAPAVDKPIEIQKRHAQYRDYLDQQAKEQEVTIHE